MSCIVYFLFGAVPYSQRLYARRSVLRLRPPGCSLAEQPQVYVFISHGVCCLGGLCFGGVATFYKVGESVVELAQCFNYIINCRLYSTEYLRTVT